MENSNKKEVKYDLKNFVKNYKNTGIFNALKNDFIATARSYNPNTPYGVEQNIRQNIGGAILGFGSLGLIGALCISPFMINSRLEAKAREASRTVMWEEFSGKVPGYNVEIEEYNLKNGSKSRIIHLKANKKEVVPNAITGHDNNRDGYFDRLFIMEKEYDACDSVKFIEDGQIWEPSPDSEHKGKAPFTEEQITNAQVKLYSALGAVRTESNKYRHWTPGMTDKDNYGLISKLNRK